MDERMTKQEMKELLLETFENLQKIDKNMLQIDCVKGNKAVSEAALIHRQFEPYTENSETMIVELLDNNFVYDGIDYKNDLEDKSSAEFAQDGLITYIIESVSRLAANIDDKISDMVVNELF